MVENCMYCGDNYEYTEFENHDFCDRCYMLYDNDIIFKCIECNDYFHKDYRHYMFLEFCEDCGSDYKMEIEN